MIDFTDKLQRKIGLRWRLPLYREYLFYFRVCKNFKDIIRFSHEEGELKKLILRNGLIFEIAGSPRYALDVFREIWHKRVYQKHYSGPPPEIVVDIGAHFGFFAIQAAHAWTSAQVYAYEPDPTNYSILCQNVANNCFPNVETFNQAIHNRPGVAYLNVKEQAESHSIYYKEGGGRNLKVVQVPTISFHELVDQVNGKVIDLLKVDCEGCEFDLFNDPQEKIWERVFYLALEFHREFGVPIQDALITPLTQLGFTVKYYPNNQKSTGMIFAINASLNPR